MAEEPRRHLLHRLHEQLRQPSALLLRWKVLHPARGAGFHGPPVRGHRARLCQQEESAEQSEQPGQGQRGGKRHAQRVKDSVCHVE